uniref:Uncharacterized protein n=1 Tax=Jaculus jaculus TaxID=51337 RepID=A0A8C5LE59_JACJA
GKGLQISHNLIDLEVRSPRVPDLTLIDLPGITRVPVGNQPADIGQQVRVQTPSPLSSATGSAPCSVSGAGSAEGTGILTKPDLVDKGTEDKVVDVVRNLVCHLKKGYMIVKCRSQKDIQMQLSLDEALRKEEDFFKDHPQFRTLLEDGKATVPCLAERLTTELITHISKCLPLLEDEIQEKYQNTNEELQKYGMGVPQDNNEKTLFLIEKINGFNQDITALIQGEESIDKEGIFRLFTKLRSEFHCWSVTINQSFSKGYEALKKEVWRLEKQHRGRELPGFVNYKAFEMIIKKQVKALEQPAVEILHKVTDMIRLTFTNTSEKHFEEFFNLHRTTKSKIEDIRLELEMEAEKSIRLHFQMEQIVYCEDQVYRKALQKVREKEEQEKNSNQSRKSNHQFQTEDLSMPEILQHLNAYYEEVHSRISSHIPLIIQHFVLQTFGERLQKSMLQLLQDTDACSQLLLERSDTREKRMFLKERLARLTQARRQLGKFTG